MAIATCPNDVIAMSDSISNIVETSSSLGVIKTDRKKITITTMQRSLVDSEMLKLRKKIISSMEVAGFETSKNDYSPAWEPTQTESKILKTYLQTYHQLFAKTPEIVAIHAGLECGVIGKLKNGIEMISFGPTIKFPHSPKEKVNINTVKQFWLLLIHILENFANKSL